MTTTTGYTRLQIALHWLIAVLIVSNYLVSEGMGEALDSRLAAQPVTGLVPTFHVWVGVAVIALALLRLIVRMVAGAPEAGDTTADKAATWVHRALYVLMLAVPVIGALTWFAGIEALGDVHVITMNAMMILALGHAGMALVHQYILKDGLLLRMMRAR